MAVDRTGLALDAGPVSTPTFATVPVHPAPDGSGAMTNLSDEDYAAMMRGSPGSGPAAPPDPNAGPGIRPLASQVRPQVAENTRTGTATDAPRADPFTKNGYKGNAEPAPQPAPTATPTTPAATPPPSPAPTDSAQPSQPVAPVHDPFTAAGYKRPDDMKKDAQDTAIPTSVQGQSVGETPPLQDVWDWTHAWLSALHGYSSGADRVIVPAAVATLKSLTGENWGEAYNDWQQKMDEERRKFELPHPQAAAAVEAAGALESPVSRFFAGQKILPGIGPRASDLGLKPLTYTTESGAGAAAKNAAIGATEGAITGAGFTEGGADERMKGALQGAELAPFVSMLAPYVQKLGSRLTSAGVTPFKPDYNLDPHAGSILRQGTNIQPGQTPYQPQLPGFRIGAGEAFNDPGLAATTRRHFELDDAAAKAMEKAQHDAIRDAAWGRGAAGWPPGFGPLPRGSISLGDKMQNIPESSRDVVAGYQKAEDVIRQEERRYWNAPALKGVTPDLDDLNKRVDRYIANLPQSERLGLEKIQGVQDILKDLKELKPGATLDDLNWVRTNLEEMRRSAGLTPSQRRIVGDLSTNLLNSIESNPALRTNPAAWKAYQDARNFTKEKWDTLGFPEFMDMSASNTGKYGRTAVDERTAAGKVLGFGEKTAGEAVPGGVQKISDMLDGIRNRWNNLRIGGVTKPGEMDPWTAGMARMELTQGLRNFVTSNFMEAVDQAARDLSGNKAIRMNAVSDWIERNRPWLSRSGIFTNDQMNLWGKIYDDSVAAGRLYNLRGGKMSPTYGLLMGGNNKWVDVFTGALGRHLAGSAIGAGLGYAGFAPLAGEGPLAAVIGGIEGFAGQHVLESIYKTPYNVLVKRLAEAAENPNIAHDLFQRVDSKQALSSDTTKWLRSFIAGGAGGTPPWMGANNAAAERQQQQGQQ